MPLHCLLSAVLFAAPTAPGLAVADFTSNGATAELASAVSGVAGNELSRLGVFRVQTADATRVLLGIERQRQILGCGDKCGAVDMSSLMGFDYLLTGKVGKLLGVPGTGPTFTLELGLLHVKTGQKVSSEIVTTKSESSLVSSVAPAVVKLVGKILQGRQGSLLLTSSEVGAAVKVDGTLIGTTPLEGRTLLSAGPHLVAVEKEGYIAWQKEVRIAPDALAEETARLVPSPDTIDAYESKASKMRLGAWLSSGVAVAGAATFIAFQLRSQSLYGRPETAGTFEYHRAALLQGIESSDGVDHRAAASALSSQLKSAQLISYIGLGTGAAAAIGAVYFWIAGESPGRYARLKEIRIQAAPIPGGATASLAGVF